MLDILRWFPLASECEIMALLNKLLHWATMCHFPAATFVPPPPHNFVKY